MKALFFYLAAALLCATPALASVIVSSPVNGATVTAPFSLVAHATLCSSRSVTAMGYSLDSRPNALVVKSNSLSVSVPASIGKHTLHVKAWGVNTACSVSLTIKVVAPPTAPVSNLTVSAPLGGSSVQSPFLFTASGTLCLSQPIAAVGYALDSNPVAAQVNGQSIDTPVTASDGTHTLHVLYWGNSGASCDTDVSITVLAPPPPPPPPPSAASIPATATAISNIQNLSIWGADFDTGTGGTGASATGVMTPVASPSVSGSALQFFTTYNNYGGERYHISIGPNAVAQNFVYDTQIYLASPTTSVGNIELDLNQVLDNGQTVIFGFQCDGWSGTWDYTKNAGTPDAPIDKWLHSNQTCTPQNWAPDTWHHVQIQYSRDDSGNVTYQSVWFDGVEQDLNVTVPSSFSLGWTSTVLLNFQVDGMTATLSSSTAYLDNTTIYSW